MGTSTPTAGQLTPQQLQQYYPGYSFNAQGQLTNNAGQAWQPPGQGSTVPAANTPSAVPPSPVTPAPTNGTPYFQGNYTFNSQGQPTGTQPTPAPSAGAQTNTVPAPQTNAQIFTQPPPSYGGLIGTLANTAGQPSQGYLQAQQTAQTALQNLQTSQTNEANALSLNAQNPIPLEFQQGRANILQNQYLAQQQAYANTYQGATAQEQAATGQQQAQQLGLGAAAGYSQPVQVPYSNQYISPVTGQPVSGSTGNYNIMSAAQNYAQMVQNGQMSYNDAVSAMGGYGVAGQQALNSALPSGFNVNQSNATAASQSSQTAQQQQYTSAASQASNLGLQLNQLIQQAGINPNDLNALNSFVQQVATNTSNPNYQTFQNLVNDLANTYAQVLTPAGGSTTDMVRQISSSLLNSTQSGQSILQVMQNLDSQVQAKIAGVTTAYGFTNTNSSGTTGGGANPWH